jgi:outer membrane protein OmpA-like peptidoglycan-associated protein
VPAPEQAPSTGDKLAKARPPARGSEAPPAESSLQSPQINNPPKGDAVTPAPPPPRIPPAGSAATKAKAPPEPPSSAPTPPTDTVMAAPPPPNIPPPQHAATANGEKTASAAPTAASDARRAAMHHVADVSFSSGSALLSDKDDDAIDAIVKQHAKDGGKIRIVGHGEAAGANAAVAGFNLALNRAQAVAVALSDKGVPSKDIAVEAAPVAASGGQDVPRAEIFFEN